MDLLEFLWSIITYKSPGVQYAWVAPVAAGVATLLGSLIGARSTRRANQMQNQANIQQQQLANQHNVEYWNMMNRYNHPSEQMARLRSAGLNPNMLYGQGVQGATGSAGSPVAAAKPAPQKFDPAISGNFLGTAVNSALSADNMLAQNSKIRADEQNVMADTNWKLAKTDLTKEERYRLKQSHNLFFKSMESANQLNYANVNLLDSQLTYQEGMNKYQNEQIANAINESKQRIKESVARIEWLKTQGLHKDAERALVEARTTFQQEENRLAKMNLFKTDPFVFRNTIGAVKDPAIRSKIVGSKNLLNYLSIGNKGWAPTFKNKSSNSVFSDSRKKSIKYNGKTFKITY